MTLEKVQECFDVAEKDEQKGRKHKGLLFTKPDRKEAQEFIRKAKKNLELSGFFRDKGFDYKIPEEWFYTLYYCALAILAMFGIESRSQRCTALFIRYVKKKSLIEHDDEFIERIQVYKKQEETSDVDAREKGRYSSLIQMKEVLQQYDEMTTMCKRAISQCEGIVFSQNKYILPGELLTPQK